MADSSSKLVTTRGRTSGSLGLAPIADVNAFAQRPWDPRVARLYCDFYDTETGGLLESDTFLCGIESEINVAPQDRRSQ